MSLSTGRFCAQAAFALSLLGLLAGWPSAAAAAEPHPPEALEIGAVAPDIEAEDIDGVLFKLSEYRGRVVVLDFWGDW